MKLDGRLIGIIFAGLLFSGIGLANAAGLWITESSKEPALIKEGDFAGMADPGDIRGSYSFGDIELAFELPSSLIAEAFGIVTDAPDSILCKDLEALYPAGQDDLEIGTGSVKQFVALYLGLPYSGDDGLPSTAVKVLSREGLWTEALNTEFAGRIVQIENLDPQGVSVTLGDAQEAEEDHETKFGVTGKTTAAQVIEWGIDKAQLEEILGTSIDNLNLTIRDICSENDSSFSEKKELINSLLDE